LQHFTEKIKSFVHNKPHILECLLHENVAIVTSQEHHGPSAPAQTKTQVAALSRDRAQSRTNAPAKGSATGRVQADCLTPPLPNLEAQQQQQQPPTANGSCEGDGRDDCYDDRSSSKKAAQLEYKFLIQKVILYHRFTLQSQTFMFTNIVVNISTV
jgi:hypothetical protein